jgi:hypothetical protein
MMEKETWAMRAERLLEEALPFLNFDFRISIWLPKIVDF